jgi:hypothetical protein
MIDTIQSSPSYGVPTNLSNQLHSLISGLPDIVLDDEIPHIAELMRHRVTYVRYSAALSLAKIGPRARAAAPFLRQSLEDVHCPEPPFTLDYKNPAQYDNDKNCAGTQELIRNVLTIIEAPGSGPAGGSDAADEHRPGPDNGCVDPPAIGVRLIAKLKSDPSTRTRTEVASAFAGFAFTFPEEISDQAISEITALLDDDAVVVRLCAAIALLNLGPRAKSKAPEILNALKKEECIGVDLVPGEIGRVIAFLRSVLKKLDAPAPPYEVLCGKAIEH